MLLTSHFSHTFLTHSAPHFSLTPSLTLTTLLITSIITMITLPSLDDRGFATLVLSAAHTLPVLLFQLTLLGLEHHGLCRQHLSQPHKTPELQLVKSCYINSAVNHFLVTPFAIWLAAPYLLKFMSVSLEQEGLPTLSTLLVDVLCCIIVEDFLFYWCHRALHLPLLYKHIHKRHHEFRILKGMSIASEYTHPVESFVGNILPVVAGPILLSSHLVTVAVWLVIRMLKTCDAHSGYNFPWSPFNAGFPMNEARRHDFHHSANMGSYGSFFVVWDRLCGTDNAFKARQRKNKMP